ncbi:hypothetical protein FHR92_002454 [Fontibacillus solani]|uniref:Uncharacterized protein n=1 Tax=Fontibacillus solani TaxID=1572857 RepID=A0A7W3XRS7_9BACL|nr:hypothetical protein [Fontibacillus solani]MBA9085982.1 hypothetical protein [Fontibacillus solani]
MKNTAKQLLLEVLLLKAKYTEQDFKAVIQSLQNENAYLREILELVSIVDDQNIRKSKSKREDSSELLLNEKMNIIQAKNPEKFQAINKVQNVLRSNELKTLKDIHKFISGRTVVPAAKKSRSSLINFYLLHLCDLSNEELIDELQIVNKFGNSRPNEVDAFLRMANKISESKK